MEKPFKIGIWFYGESTYADGGSHSYITQMHFFLSTNQFEGIEIVSVGFEEKKQNSSVSYIRLKPFHENWIFRLIGSFLIRVPFLKNYNLKLKEKYNNKLYKKLENVGIELIYYAKPGVIFPNFPHIATVWDNGHISSYPFPEVSANGNLEGRLDNFVVDLNKAILICCESNTGRKELQDFYPVSPNRIAIIPMMGSEVVENYVISETINSLTEESFFFYPAKYWPHKNHYNLIKAFAIFSQKHPQVKLIFTGYNQNNPGYINKCIDDENLSEKIIQLGVVNLGELKWLYLNAIAMVMPTLLGPTNMPLIEAYQLNCKVVCSNLDGHKEQLGNYGIYFDPLNPYDIAEKLAESFSSKSVLVSIEKKANISYSNIAKILNKAKAIRRTWP